MYPKYINIFSIYIFGLSFSISIGNPMWFIQEYRKQKGGE